MADIWEQLEKLLHAFDCYKVDPITFNISGSAATALMTRLPPGEFVYFVREVNDNSRVKIGETRVNPKSRRTMIQFGNPHKVEIYQLIRIVSEDAGEARKLEQGIHKILHSRLCEGGQEWFHFSTIEVTRMLHAIPDIELREEEKEAEAADVVIQYGRFHQQWKVNMEMHRQRVEINGNKIKNMKGEAIVINENTRILLEAASFVHTMQPIVTKVARDIPSSFIGDSSPNKNEFGDIILNLEKNNNVVVPLVADIFCHNWADLFSSQFVDCDALARRFEPGSNSRAYWWNRLLGVPSFTNAVKNSQREGIRQYTIRKEKLQQAEIDAGRLVNNVTDKHPQLTRYEPQSTPEQWSARKFRNIVVRALRQHLEDEYRVFVRKRKGPRRYDDVSVDDAVNGVDQTNKRERRTKKLQLDHSFWKSLRKDNNIPGDPIPTYPEPSVVPAHSLLSLKSSTK